MPLPFDSQDSLQSVTVSEEEIRQEAPSFRKGKELPKAWLRFKVVYWGNIGIMEKRMEAAIVYGGNLKMSFWDIQRRTEFKV